MRLLGPIVTSSMLLLCAACVQRADAQLILQNEWQFTEPAGAVAFASVGDVHGVVSPGASLGGGVATFSGLRFPDSSIIFGSGVGQFGYDDFAVEFRMRSSQVEVFGSPIEVMGNRDTDGDGNFFSVRGAFGGVLAVEISDGFTFNGFESGTVVFDGAWHDVRIERTGSLLSLLIDGQLDSSLDSFDTVFIANGNDLLFGNQYVSAIVATAPFVGQLDDLRVYIVPAPGPAAVVCLAGLLAARRRR